MNAKYSIVFNRKGKLNSQGKALIQIRVHFNQNISKFVSTDIYIAPEHWDPKKKIIKDTHSAHYTLNKKIKNRIEEMEDFENDLIKYNEPFNKEVLDEFVKGKFKREELTFNRFYQQELDKIVNSEPSTVETWMQTLKKINGFNSHIRFKDINYNLVSSFDNYLAISGAKSVNSRWKHHKNFKKFLNIAIAKGYYDLKDYPYESNAPGGKIGKFQVTREDGVKTPLDFEEVQRLWELEYPNHPHLQRTLDVYLFMCFTGLRISDASSVELFEYLHHSSSGYSIDLKRMKKLRRQVYLELYTLFEGKPDTIIRKYLIDKFGSDEPSVLAQKIESSIFGNIDKDRFNRYLKLIAHDAQILKNLSAHTARHTFGTQMAALTDGNINMVMDLMGISKYETAKVYIKLADRILNKRLRKVKWDEYNEVIKKPEDIMEPTVSNNPKDDGKADQILQYIYKHVLPEIKGINGHKIPLAIEIGSLSAYTSKMPFNSEFIAELKKKPFEISGIVYGMENSDYLDKLQKSINNHKWFKQSFLKLSLMLMPFDDNSMEKVLV